MGCSSNWNRSAGGGAAAERRPRARLAAWSAAGVLVAAGIFLAANLILRDEAPGEDPAPAVKPARIAEVAPQAAPKAEPAAEKDPVDPKKEIDPGYLKGISPKLPPKKYLPTLEEVEKARLGPDGKPRKMSIYKTPIEQALGVIFTTPLGSPPPPLPSIPSISSESQLEAFFATTLAYDKDASKAVNENRILMTQVREEFRKYLEDGGDAKGFVDYYMGELRASHEQWKTAQMMLVDMSRSGEDAQSLRAFRDKANAILAERGIKPLAVPPSVRRSMGEE